MASFSDWISKPVALVVSVIAFIGTITGFIVGFRADPHLTLVVLSGIVAAAIIVGLLFLAVSTKRELIGETEPQFPRRVREWAMIFAAIAVVAVIYAFVHPDARAWIIRPDKLPEEAPKRADTPKPIEPRPLPPSARRTIILAEYDVTSGSPPVTMRHRLYEVLTEKIADLQINGIRLVMDPTVVKTPEEAKELAESRDVTAVIYGYADGGRIATSVFLNERPGSSARIETEHVAWEALPVAGSISVSADSAVDQASFIALFVVGELLYLDNRYGEGVRALDEAQSTLPKGLRLKQSALLHFITARAAQQQLPFFSPISLAYDRKTRKAVVDIACEYAEAIRLDHRMYQAYNNLGTIVARDVLAGYAMESSAVSDDVKQCVQRAGLSVNRADELFAKAAAMRPDLTAISYNRLAMEWAASRETGPLSSRPDKFGKRVEQLLEKDNTIAGAWVMLAVIAFERGNNARALETMQRAASLRPDMPGVHADLGQIYWRAGNKEQAQTAFAQELTTHPDDELALLSSASVAVQQSDYALATTRLASLQRLLSPRDPKAVIARIILADIAATQNDVSAAASLCREAAKLEIGESAREEGEGNLPIFLMAFYQARAGATADARKSARRITDSRESEQPGLWEAFIKSCPRTENDVQWLRSACARRGVSELFRSVFAQAQGVLHHQYFVFADLG
jgi:tetratricopeptide (TPR) repeat protein